MALCGSKEELKAKLEKLVAEKLNNQTVAFKSIGFTTAMDKCMLAADVIVGKPGGLTTSEALAKGLVFVVVNPIPRQEERNFDHLLEEGCAICCNNLPTLAYKFDKLLSDKKCFETMKESALRLAHPNASQKIVNKLLRL